MIGKIIALSSMVALVAVVFILYLTTPATIGPFGIFILFVLLYVGVVGLFTFVLFLGSRALTKIMSLITKRIIAPFTLMDAYYFASVIALGPVMIVGMQSVGQVGAYEVVLVGLFTLVGCIYIAKKTR